MYLFKKKSRTGKTSKSKSVKSGKSSRKSMSELREKEIEVKTYQQQTKENERYEEFIKEYILIIGKYLREIFGETIEELLEIFKEDTEEYMELMKEGKEYIEEEKRTEELKEEIKQNIKLHKYEITEKCMELLHTLNDTDEN